MLIKIRPRTLNYVMAFLMDGELLVGPGLLWMSDRPVADTSTWQHTTLTREKHPYPPAGFEPEIPASQRPQTHALNGAAMGIANYVIYTMLCK